MTTRLPVTICAILVFLFASCVRWKSDPVFIRSFVLADRQGGSWVISSPSGQVIKRIDLPSDAVHESISPSLDSFVFNHLGDSAKSDGKAVFSLMMQGNDAPAKEVFSRAVDYRAGEKLGRRKFTWLSADGGALLLLIGDELSLVQRSVLGYSRQDLCSGVLDSSGFGDLVVYLNKGESRELHRCRLLPAKELECSSIPLAHGINGVEVLDTDTVLVSRRDEEDHSHREFQVLDLRSGTLRTPRMQEGGTIWKVIPVAQSRKVLLHRLGGERLDGTRKTSLLMWDWETGEEVEVGYLDHGQEVYRRAVPLK